MDLDQTKLDQAKAVKKVCLENAESLLQMAERELGKGADHACFHLALLALEEIGKSILAVIQFSIDLGGRDTKPLENAAEEHEKKIFWAIWGKMLEAAYTKEQIEGSIGLAKRLHARRQEVLYTDPANLQSPAQRMTTDEAKQLVDFVKVRLEIEKQAKIADTYTEEDAINLKWFLTAVKEEDKWRFIFGGDSIRRLEELNDGKAWIKWLMGHFAQNEERMKELAVSEMNRQKPSDGEASKPKYKLRVRIQSPSHDIANKAFDVWNKGVERIVLTKATRKEMKPYAKSEVLMDFTFPKSIPLQGLYHFALSQIKSLVMAFNVVSKGIFWWHVPRDLDKFYETATDLENSAVFSVGINPRLSIDWDTVEPRLVINQAEVSRIGVVAGFFWHEGKMLEKFLLAYASGMALLSKTDIHFRFEANAFEQFFVSFKEALIALGDWDGKSDLVEAASKGLLPAEPKNLKEILQLGLEQGADPFKPRIITLTEVIAIKMYTDAYVEKKAREHAIRLIKEEEAPDNQNESSK